MATRKNTPEIPSDKLQLYDLLIASHPDIERKGKTMPYTSHNGHMFSYLSKEGKMGLRLGKEEREAFLEEHDSTLFEQHGSIMKEYVTIPDDLLADTKRLLDYLQLSYEYVASLKPKTSKKKK